MIQDKGNICLKLLPVLGHCHCLGLALDERWFWFTYFITDQALAIKTTL